MVKVTIESEDGKVETQDYAGSLAECETAIATLTHERVMANFKIRIKAVDDSDPNKPVEKVFHDGFGKDATAKAPEPRRQEPEPVAAEKESEEPESHHKSKKKFH